MPVKVPDWVRQSKDLTLERLEKDLTAAVITAREAQRVWVGLREAAEAASNKLAEYKKCSNCAFWEGDEFDDTWGSCQKLDTLTCCSGGFTCKKFKHKDQK